MDITNHLDKHSIIPSSSTSSSTTTSSYTSNQHKVKRLKILQEIEDRKLQLNYNRLMKEQNKICRQLDIQRLQLTRRFSETNFNLSFDELTCKLLKNDNIILDFKKCKQIKQQSPPPQQQQHSITMNDRVHSSYYNLNSQDNTHNNDYLNQPFWLRLRSLGLPSDEDTLLAALTFKNMNINEKLETNLNEDDVFESIYKPSTINDPLTGRISRNIQKQRSSSVTGADEILKNVLNNNNNNSNNNNNTKRIKRSLSLEEKKPNWLLTLNQMKREKLSRTNSNIQEEITALFKGNKFYGNKRSNVITIKYQSRNDRLIKSHRHTIVGITHEFTPS